jgi:PKD repeat protein
MNRILLLIGLIFICLSGLYSQGNGSCNGSFTFYAIQNTYYFMSTDSSVKWSYWTFGDGGAQSGIGVSHSYASPGTYIVTHVVEDTSKHCADSATQIIPVNFSPGCSISIQIQGDSLFPGGPPFNPNQYTFIASPTILGSTVDSILWSIDSLVISLGPSLLYTFHTAGNHTVCAILKTSSGCTATDCKNVTVGGTDSCHVAASFTYTQDSSQPRVFLFRDNSAGQGSDLGYLWNFGDGTFTTSANPTHIFPSKGFYLVSLTVTDSTGCQSEVAQTIAVSTGPADTCSINLAYSASASSPNTISFTVTGGQPFASEVWKITQIPDSSFVTTLTADNPTYQFPQIGSYAVSLVATTQSGCVNTAFIQINIDSMVQDNGSSVAHSALAYPNPAANQVTMRVPLSTSTLLKVNVYNSMGTLVQASQVQGVPGSNPITILVQNLPTGIYYLEVQSANSITRSRFTKL